MATKYQLPDGKKLATFKIEEERWEAFKALCDVSETSASATLNNFIKGCLDAGKIDNIALASSPSSQGIAFDEQALEARLMARLEARLEEALTGK